MKVCTGCKQQKDLIEFHKKGDGRQAQCKTCRTAYDRLQYRTNPQQKKVRRESVERYKRNFRAWYSELKKKPCADCKKEFHFAAMQWDHLPGQGKTGNLSKMVAAGNKTKILNEISKCQLVCANCHAVRTYNRTGESVATV